MVGAVTLRRDNPRLRVKSPERRAARKARGLPEELLRVVVTRNGKLGRDLRVWTAAGEKIIYCPDAAADALHDALGDLATIVALGDGVDLRALLDDLGSRGIGRLMVEGGEQIHTQFLAADLADELHVTIGGFFVADPAAPRFVTPGVRLPQSAARRMRLAEVSRAGETAVLRYLVRPAALSSPQRVPTRAAPRRSWTGGVPSVELAALTNRRGGRPGPGRAGCAHQPPQRDDDDVRVQREPQEPRQQVPYRCEHGHEFAVTLAAQVAPPRTWDCRCGVPAHHANTISTGNNVLEDQDHHRRRMALLLQRRSAAELEQILADRLAELAARKLSQNRTGATMALAPRPK
jgi:5-amino-6-(5-phosphoribosylamino)uracil reductase